MRCEHCWGWAGEYVLAYTDDDGHEYWEELACTVCGAAWWQCEERDLEAAE